MSLERDTMTKIHEKNASIFLLAIRRIIIPVLFLLPVSQMSNPLFAGDLLLKPSFGSLHYQRDFYGDVKTVVFPTLNEPSWWAWVRELSFYDSNFLYTVIDIPFISAGDDGSGLFPPEDPNTTVTNWELY